MLDIQVPLDYNERSINIKIITYAVPGHETDCPSEDAPSDRRASRRACGSAGLQLGGKPRLSGRVAMDGLGEDAPMCRRLYAYLVEGG